MADIEGSYDVAREALGIGPTTGFDWSTDRIWAESGDVPMAIDSDDAAEGCLTSHRKKQERSEIQP